MSRAQRFDQHQIEQSLAGLTDWTVEGGKLMKQFAFESYASGALFVATVAFLADELDHHPDIVLGYRRVTISLNTHDVEGISNLDFELAEKIESLFIR